VRSRISRQAALAARQSVLVLVLVGLGACAAAQPSVATSPSAAPAPGPAGASASAGAPAVPVPALGQLRMSWSSPTSGPLPLHAALQQGFFEQRGLVVEPVFVAGAQAIAALTAREIDVSYADGTALVRAALAGSDVVMLASTNNVLPYRLIAQPGLQRPEDLRGKRLGITRFGTLSDFGARYLLRALGLTPDAEVALIQVGNAPDLVPSLAAGAIDAGMFGMPEGYYALQQGYVSLYDLAAVSPEYPNAPIGALRSAVVERPEGLRALIAGLAEALAWIKQNRLETIQILASYTKMEDFEALAATYDEHVPRWPRVPYATPASVATVLEFIRADEPRAATAQPTDFIDDRFVRELEQSGYFRQLYP